MAEEQDVLKLQTFRKRRWIIIDDKRIEMRDQNELAMTPAVRLKVLTSSVREADSMNEEGASLLSQRLEAAMKDVLIGLTDDLGSKLTDEQRMDVLLAFFKAPEKLAPKPAENLQPSVS